MEVGPFPLLYFATAGIWNDPRSRPDGWAYFWHLRVDRNTFSSQEWASLGYLIKSVYGLPTALTGIKLYLVVNPVPPATTLCFLSYYSDCYSFLPSHSHSRNILEYSFLLNCTGGITVNKLKLLFPFQFSNHHSSYCPGVWLLTFSNNCFWLLPHLILI